MKNQALESPGIVRKHVYCICINKAAGVPNISFYAVRLNSKVQHLYFHIFGDKPAAALHLLWQSSGYNELLQSMSRTSFASYIDKVRIITDKFTLVSLCKAEIFRCFPSKKTSHLQNLSRTAQKFKFFMRLLNDSQKT